MIHRFLRKLFIVLILGMSLCLPMHANQFLDAAHVEVDTVIDKKSVHKQSPLEFRHAVTRYIKHTDHYHYQGIQRNSDAHLSYKKELRYLFKNYEKFSVSVLLSRLRSAHQTMVKQNTDHEGEEYKKYEQICSALLLTCAQVFVIDARNQILQALDEIDNLIVYWRYQQHHQISYFFHKSPVKWVVGKKQEKEIIHNILCLERIQGKLYTLLGALTEHLYVFSETEMTYTTCYEWIEQLLTIVSCIPVSRYKSDGTLFDTLAAQLELKIKWVGKLKDDCMSSVKMTQKPSHFVRHWIGYTTALAAIGYALHYNSKNPEIVRSAINAVQDEAKKFLILLLHPLKKIYERGKLIFSDDNKTEDPKKHVSDNVVQEKIIDREAELDELVDKIIDVGKGLESKIAEELAKSCTTLREDALASLDDVITTMQNPQDGLLISSTYEVDADGIRNDMQAIITKIERITQNGIVVNEQAAQDYEAALKRIYKAMDDLSDKLWSNGTGIELKAQLLLTKKYLMVIDQFLDPLQKYTDIIDKNIVPLFLIASQIIENLILQAKGLIKNADKLMKNADELVKNAEELEIQAAQKLQDLELTLMFTSLIPLGIISFIASKAYTWIIERDYSLIRIALADVNSLLIESSEHLDDHDYGKLVYLICKLRHKSTTLKDPLSNEFLADVTKLESKQYSAPTKSGIVENMFNKYAFLGRIAV